MIRFCRRALYALCLLATLAVAPPLLAQDEESEWDERALDEMKGGDTEDAESAVSTDEGEVTSSEPQFLPAERVNEHSCYRSTVSDYVYDPSKGDPDSGAPPGTSFEALPLLWTSPDGISGADFHPAEC